MHGSQHLDFGLVALELEFLDLPAFGAALMEVGRAGADTPFDAIWLRSGRLEQGEFDQVVNRLFGGAAGDRQTLAFDSEILVRPAKNVAALVGNELTEEQDFGPVKNPDANSPSPEPWRYLRVAVRATGGMGEVVECVDKQLGRRVALKMLRSDIDHSEGARAMLEREAMVIGSLQHPNIIPVYDAGRRNDIGSYYVMRFVNEPTLESVLETRRSSDFDAGRYSLDHLLRYFIQVCDALEYAHSRGVIHCDMKPANILLGEFGEVLVVDWGLAYRVDEGTMYRGGTPGYMAPEQLQGNAMAIDARTDVFALGAILYEILSLRPAFSELSPSDFVRGMVENGTSVLKPPPRPSEHLDSGTIPAELEDVCMKALSLDKKDRYPSARAIAVDIENFVTGSKERERSEKRAAELVEEGALLAKNFGDSLEIRAEMLDEMRELRTRIAPWESVQKKRTLWEAQERLQVTEAVGIRTMQAAVSVYEQALDEVPGHPEARRGLADLYCVEMRRAQERRDDHDRIYFEELVKQYSDETAGAATLLLDRKLAKAYPRLAVYEEYDHRLVPRQSPHIPRELSGRTELAAGSYLLTLSPKRREPVFLPLLLQSGREVQAQIDLRAVSELGEGEVYVAAGSALLGTSDPATGLAEMREQDLPAFVIQARPVSFAEYLQFLASMLKDHHDLAGPCVPASGNNSPYWKWDGKSFEPAGITAFIIGRSDPQKLPAFGISLAGARAYARWKSERTGYQLDLPTERQWEKAARGADGRRYPWGDQFDASFCKIRESRPGAPLPEASGSFTKDVSPWGVRDMAGGLADWVLAAGTDSTEQVTQAVSRGGAWCDWSADSDLGARRVYRIHEHPPRVGFRLTRAP